MSNTEVRVNIPAIILAGGFGTRLRDVLSNAPKPLAPVGEFPFIYYCIERLIFQGINQFIFSLHYKAQMIIDYIKSLDDSLLKECVCKFSVEADPLGTGGAIKHALDLYPIDTPFLVLNGDTYLGGDYNPLLSTDAPAIGLTKVEETNRYGSVIVGENGYIKNFKEKDGSFGSGFINAGIYLLNSETFDPFDKDQSFSVERDVFPQLVEKKILRGAEIKGQFIDIGIPADYYKFCDLMSDHD